jgi:hypothetical protein
MIPKRAVVIFMSLLQYVKYWIPFCAANPDAYFGRQISLNMKKSIIGNVILPEVPPQFVFQDEKYLSKLPSRQG